MVYSFRYRNELPQTVREKSPPGRHWIIWPAGRAKYKFLATDRPFILPNSLTPETRVPDATPGVIAKYALSDEQTLLAKLRYNRLIDIFTGVACYSLQSHLRTAVTDMGQVETDEIYIGVDKRGAHYVFPIQAKGGSDKISIVQIGQDLAMCAEKFPSLICRPIAAQFLGRHVTDPIALFLFQAGSDLPEHLYEKHYRLIDHGAVTLADLAEYRQRPWDTLDL